MRPRRWLGQRVTYTKSILRLPNAIMLVVVLRYTAPRLPRQDTPRFDRCGLKTLKLGFFRRIRYQEEKISSAGNSDVRRRFMA